jgi:hypothetical protein
MLVGIDERVSHMSPRENNLAEQKAYSIQLESVSDIQTAIDNGVDTNIISAVIAKLPFFNDRYELGNKLNRRERERVHGLINDPNVDANTISAEIMKLSSFNDRYELGLELSKRSTGEPTTAQTNTVGGVITKAFTPDLQRSTSHQRLENEIYQPNPNSMEAHLREMYSDDNFDTLVAKPPKRAGQVAFLATNESFPNGELVPSRQPDGYIIGVGNGSIWSMLEMFDEENPPKGIIALDIDPSVVLGGMVLVELAKQGISREKAIALLYGDIFSDPQRPATIFPYQLSDLDDIVQKVLNDEQNPNLTKALGSQLIKNTFRKDAEFARYKHGLDYKKPKLLGGPGERRTLNTPAMIFDHWDTIVKLAQEGKIFFGLADFTNENVLDFISGQIPDATQHTNVIYASNILDHFYRAGLDDANLSALERFNPDGKSFYVSTRTNKKYELEITDAPPSL